jgi:N2227-like protein
VEANEVSGVMVCALQTMITKVLGSVSLNGSKTTKTAETDRSAGDLLAGGFRIHPSISPRLSDTWDFAAKLESVDVPGHDSQRVSEWVKARLREANLPQWFSIQMGDFTSVYGGSAHRGKFDAVVTCFFFDTAPEVLTYLAVIANILRPDGIWINAGPLHYHMRSAIPYSHRDLTEVIRHSGFELLSHTKIDPTSYNGEDEGDITMKPEYYSIPIDVYRFSNPSDAWVIDESDEEGEDKLSIDTTIVIDSSDEANSNHVSRLELTISPIPRDPEEELWQRPNYILI